MERRKKPLTFKFPPPRDQPEEANLHRGSIRLCTQAHAPILAKRRDTDPDKWRSEDGPAHKENRNNYMQAKTKTKRATRFLDSLQARGRANGMETAHNRTGFSLFLPRPVKTFCTADRPAISTHTHTNKKDKTQRKQRPQSCVSSMFSPLSRALHDFFVLLVSISLSPSLALSVSFSSSRSLLFRPSFALSLSCTAPLGSSF